jgi:hypothetical protein
MKLKVLSFSLFSVAALSPFLMPSLTLKANALGCTLTDVAVQVDVSGNPSQSQQNNNVNQQFGQNCKGNSVTNTATQVHNGSNAGNQNRNSSQSAGSGALGDDGIGNVKTQIHVPVSVENPAANPNFLNGIPGVRK